MTKYKVFSRSAKNWDEFATARKTIIRQDFTDRNAAREFCLEFNDNRTDADIQKGKKYEFLQI